MILITSCFTRRNVMKEEFSQDMKKLKESMGNPTLVGFTCSGEIGAKEGELANCHHLTDNIFVFYGRLLINKKD